MVFSTGMSPTYSAGFRGSTSEVPGTAAPCGGGGQVSESIVCEVAVRVRENTVSTRFAWTAWNHEVARFGRKSPGGGGGAGSSRGLAAARELGRGGAKWLCARHAHVFAWRRKTCADAKDMSVG